MALKDVIKEARLKEKLKQEEAAELVGVTVQTYSKWENGKTEPKASQVAKLSEILGISTAAICKGEMSQKMDPMEFMRAYSKLAKDVSDFDAIMAVWGTIDDDKEFLKGLQGYAEMTDSMKS